VSHMSAEKRGVVLEYNEGSVTILTPQGEFLSIPWTKTPCPEIGSEIVFNEPAAPKIRFRYTGLAAIAACLLVVFLSVSLWSGVFLPDSRQVVAYVSVDINPSIELGLNKEGKVVKSVGLNSDGELLLQKLALNGLTVDEAVELITQAAVENNYITAEKENTVLITVSEPHKVPEEVKKLEQKVEAKLTANQLSATTKVLEVSGDIRKKAKKLGVSPGKYIVLLEAVDKGLELSVEDIKGDSVVQAIKKAGGVPGEIISKAQQDKDSYKELEKRNVQKLRQIAQQRPVSAEKSSWAFREKKDEKEDKDGLADHRRRDEAQNFRNSKENDSDKENRDNKNSWSGRTGQNQERQASSADDRDEDENSKWNDNRRDSQDRNDDDNKDKKASGSNNGNKDKDDGKEDKDKDKKDNDRDNDKDNSSKKGENVRNNRSSQDKDNDKDNNDKDDVGKEDGSQDKDPERDSGKTQRQNNLQEYTKRFWQWWR